MSELSNETTRLGDAQGLSRAIIGAAGALSGAVIAVGVPVGILHFDNVQQYNGNYGRGIATAIMGAVLLGSIVSLLSVLTALKKR
jgi:hypothetical protein